MRLVVVIDVDGEPMYVPENTHGFLNGASPKVFDNMRDAEEEREKWNTGIIMDYDTHRSVPSIRSFTDDERQRAKERERVNSDTHTT
tara:strand:- start:868 stop:1128 length:261 start_codon:yes stop_codon:yes gene_type:complete